MGEEQLNGAERGLPTVTDDKGATGDFLGGPVVKTLHFYCRGHWFTPQLGN